MYTKQGEVKIADFGNALIAKGDYMEAAEFPAYLSPEQANKGHITHQADIYSLGVVMFRLLTGCLPFNADDSFSYVDKVMHEAPLNIRELRPEIPEKLAAIMRCTIAANFSGISGRSSRMFNGASCITLST